MTSVLIDLNLSKAALNARISVGQTTGQVSEGLICARPAPVFRTAGDIGLSGPQWPL